MESFFIFLGVVALIIVIVYLSRLVNQLDELNKKNADVLSILLKWQENRSEEPVLKTAIQENKDDMLKQTEATQLITTILPTPKVVSTPAAMTVNNDVRSITAPPKEKEELVQPVVQELKVETSEQTQESYGRWMPKAPEPQPVSSSVSETPCELLPKIAPPPVVDKETIVIQEKRATEKIKPITSKPKVNKKDLEKIFGINLLSKIGIATLVLGIAYFVKYAIDQNWINEIGRVAIGVAAGGLLLGIAHKLRKNYRTFSSLLVGGGIAALYITIAFAFWEYKLFSQSIAFTLLIFITALSVLLSISYDRRELAIFSLLGGFASPLMVSSGTGNYIVLFTYLLVLNTGILVLAFKKNWKILGILSYILSAIFYLGWLFRSFEDQYAGAAVFALLFFVQFYTLILINYFKAQERKMTPLQATLMLSNNLLLFSAGLYIFHDFSINLKGVCVIMQAMLNAIPLWLVLKDKAENKNMLYLLLSLVLTFVTLAAPVQLRGGAITMFWAAEAAILLFLFQQSKIKIFRTGYFIVQIITIAAIIMDWVKYYGNGTYPSSVSPFVTGMIVVASLWVIQWLLSKQPLIIVSEGTKQSTSELIRPLSFMVLFIVLLLELRYRLNLNYDSDSFVNEITGVYTYLFLAVCALIYAKSKKNKFFYDLLIISVLCYVFIYLFIIANVRKETIAGELSGWGYLAAHYISIPALVVILRFLINRAAITKIPCNILYWCVAVVSMIVVSVETDNLMLMCFFDRVSAAQTLSYSHTIAYPVLWGLGSFILMILGMKYKNRQLRIISLSIFALVILKLYAYDIWQMSQTGRIIAFVFLGLLFLLVSFLYQKLKILLQKNEDENEKIY